MYLGYTRDSDASYPQSACLSLSFSQDCKILKHVGVTCVFQLKLFVCFLSSNFINLILGSQVSQTPSFPPQVAHFSKYGLLDSDEEEEVPLKADPKKLKTMSIPSSGLQQKFSPSQQQVAPLAQVEQPGHEHHQFL